MKKYLLAVTMIISILLPSSPVFANEAISVFMDGSEIFYDTQPIIENGTTMVPLKQTFEALHANVVWEPKAKTVTSTRDNTTVYLQVGDDVAYKNGNPIDLAVAPKIINGRTYIPLRFVAESFGADVTWVQDEKRVYINSFYIIDDYDPNFVETEYVPYSTGSLETLFNVIAKGYVVVINGEYYATPEYATRLYHGLHIPVDNSNFDREGSYDDGTDSEYVWVSGINFEFMSVSEEYLDGIDLSKLEEEIPGYYEVYGFFDYSGWDIKPIYLFPDMTEDFLNSENAEGTFSGIRMKMDDGYLWFYIPDLDAKGIEH